MPGMSMKNAPARPETSARARLGATTWLLAAAALSSAGPANAAPGQATAQLEYQLAPGAERCPDEGALREEVARQLGYDPVDPRSTARLLAMIFRGPAREMHATMELSDAAGVVTWSRHLVAYNDDCRELVLNMALSIRVALDPSLRLQPPCTGPGCASRPTPSAPAPAPSQVRAPRSPRARPAGPSLRAGVGGSVSFGTLPLLSGGPSIELDLRYPRFSIGLEGRFDLPTTIDIFGGHQITSWHAGASVSPCAHARYLFGCALLSLGAMVNEAKGTKLADEAPSPVLAAGPRAGVEVSLSDRLAARLHGDLEVRISRSELSVGGARPLWTSPAFIGLLGVRITLKLATPRGLTGAAVRAAP